MAGLDDEDLYVQADERQLAHEGISWTWDVSFDDGEEGEKRALKRPPKRLSSGVSKSSGARNATGPSVVKQDPLSPKYKAAGSKSSSPKKYAISGGNRARQIKKTPDSANIGSVHMSTMATTPSRPTSASTGASASAPASSTMCTPPPSSEQKQQRRARWGPPMRSPWGKSPKGAISPSRPPPAPPPTSCSVDQSPTNVSSSKKSKTAVAGLSNSRSRSPSASAGQPVRESNVHNMGPLAPQCAPNRHQGGSGLGSGLGKEDGSRHSASSNPIARLLGATSRRLHRPKPNVERSCTNTNTNTNTGREDVAAATMMESGEGVGVGVGVGDCGGDYDEGGGGGGGMEGERGVRSPEMLDPGEGEGGRGEGEGGGGGEGEGGGGGEETLEVKHTSSLVWEIDFSDSGNGKSGRRRRKKQQGTTTKATKTPLSRKSATPQVRSSTTAVQVEPRAPATAVHVGREGRERGGEGSHCGHHQQGRSAQPLLATVLEQMEQRKVLDLKRWYCMSRPQYSRSCGISSVVSCWNYLFSSLGNGSLPPITQEEALTHLGFSTPFEDVQFGPFTGNATVMRWFQELCCLQGVSGQAYYFYKPCGKRKTLGIKPALAMERLKSGLRDPSMAFVYHCHNHYFCPVGFEEVPKRPSDAYKVNLSPEDTDLLILIGDPSKSHPSIHFKKWSDIMKDLTTERPQYFNIRHTERGVEARKTTKSARKAAGGTLHCIMAFKKLESSHMFHPVRGGAEQGDGAVCSSTPSEDLESSDCENQSLPSSLVAAERNRSKPVQPATTSGGQPLTQTDLFVDAGDENIDGPLPVASQIVHVPPSSHSTYNDSDQVDHGGDGGGVCLSPVTANDQGMEETLSVGLRRSGTFTRRRKGESLSEEDSGTGDDRRKNFGTGSDSPDLEKGEDNVEKRAEESYADSTERRSRTYTRRKRVSDLPSSMPSVQQSVESVNPDSDQSDSSNNEVPEGSLRRTGTYTKRKKATPRKLFAEDPDQGDAVATAKKPVKAVLDDELLLSGGRMKRSGTFTKEKPASQTDDTQAVACKHTHSTVQDITPGALADSAAATSHYSSSVPELTFTTCTGTNTSLDDLTCASMKGSTNQVSSLNKSVVEHSPPSSGGVDVPATPPSSESEQRQEASSHGPATCSSSSGTSSPESISRMGEPESASPFVRTGTFTKRKKRTPVTCVQTSIDQQPAASTTVAADIIMREWDPNRNSNSNSETTHWQEHSIDDYDDDDVYF